MRDLRNKTINTITSFDRLSLDEFGRLPIAHPQTLFDAQFTYDLQPLLYEQIRSGTGATVSHDSTNRRASCTLSGTAAGGYSYMQTFEHFRYQPGKEQGQVFTINYGAAASNARSWAGYYDKYSDVGIRLIQDTDGIIKFQIRSNTSVGDQSKDQSEWNGDLVASGKTLDPTKDIIYKITFQALYVGDVTLWIQIDDKLIRAHTFYNSGQWAYPYIETANLPVSFGVEAVGGSATKTITFNCTAVSSSGGVDETVGYEFSTPDTSVTAGSGARTHLLSLRPRTTFNSIVNRSKVALIEVNLLVTGANPVFWELCLGQSFSAGPTWANINATYSANEYGYSGTLSGGSTILVDSGYIAATASQKSATQMSLTSRYPITLDAAGAVRSLGTIHLIVTGIGGSSATRGTLKVKEIR